MKKIDDIKTILIAGAGTLGLRIGLRCAMDGYQVVMYDISEKQLDDAKNMQAYLCKTYLGTGQVTQEMVDRAQGSIKCTTNLEEACQNIDLVSESCLLYTSPSPRDS